MSEKLPHGIIDQSVIGRKNDYLYRLSVKALIRDGNGRVLAVKESGRTWWDLPGGGMDHNESVKSAIKRELQEEIKLQGNFEYRVIAVDNPGFVEHANIWQVRLVFEVIPDSLDFSAGDDADHIRFIDPVTVKNSEYSAERSIYTYSAL